jgi:dTDP-4-dehydrorhamnose reductase
LKILITGLENSLAKYIYCYFKNEHNIYVFNNETLDSSDKNLCFNVITNINPQIVIHCETMDNMESCEKNESSAYKVNTIGTLNIAYPCSILNIPIIYLSTSYVYSGEKNSSYFETDDCKPVNIYGKTKLSGERLIRTLCKKYFILRCGWIFGTENCFVRKIIKNMNVPILFCSTEIGNPTYAEDLCILIKEMLQSNLYGIYNCGNDNAINKTVFVKELMNFCKVKKNILELPRSINLSIAPRPKNCSLNMSLIKNCFNVNFPFWEDRLKEYISNNLL